MHIHHIRIENVKSFGADHLAVDLDLGRPDGSPAGWTVVAGRNGAGKSTFLQAIAMALAGPEAARVLHKDWSTWVRHGAESARVEAGVRVHGPDNFVGGGRTVERSFWAGLQWTLTGTGPAPAMTPVRVKSSSIRTSERGPWAENPSGWLVAGYGPFRRVSKASYEALEMMKGLGHVPRLVSLFREDASLAESVTWLISIYTRRLEERPGSAELERDVLRLLKDGLLPQGFVVDHIDSDGLWIEGGGVVLALEQVSDGYRTVAALILDIVRNMHNTYGSLGVEQSKGEDGPVVISHPGVVLIDEIDAHLHVSWQQRIGPWLKTRFPNVQFIVSTHSPFICQAADRNGLIRLPAPGERRPAEHVTGELFREVTKGSADEAIMTELFGLDHTHSDESERLRRQLAELETRLLGTEHPSAEDQRQLSLLRDELPHAGPAAVDQAWRLLRAATRDEH
jgi:hypothetical protein